MGTGKENRLTIMSKHLFKPGESLFFLVTMLAPLHKVFATMTLLIVVDFITALYAAWRTKGISSLNSRKMGNTLSKFLFYNLVIVSAHFVEVSIIPEIPLLKVVGGFIAMTELKSILENFNLIYGINITKAVRRFFHRQELGDAILEEENQPTNEKGNRNGNDLGPNGVQDKQGS
jgi:phage-related holin